MSAVAPAITSQYVTARDPAGLRSTWLRRGLRQVDVAVQAGVSEPVLVRAVHGLPIRARSAFAIAAALELEAEALFGDAA